MEGKGSSVLYKVAVTTGDLKNCGTDAKVSFTRFVLIKKKQSISINELGKMEYFLLL